MMPKAVVFMAMEIPAVSSVGGTAAVGGFAVGDGGTILKVSGLSAVSMEPATGEDLYDVWGRDLAGVYAAGDGGVVVRYDELRGWLPAGTGFDVDLRGVWASDTGEVFVAGRGGAILRRSP